MQGAQRLSCMLNTNSTLTSLNLRGNKIGDGGAQTLRNGAFTCRCHSFAVILYYKQSPYGGHLLSEGLLTVKVHGREDKPCSLTYLNLVGAI